MSWGCCKAGLLHLAGQSVTGPGGCCYLGWLMSALQRSHQASVERSPPPSQHLTIETLQKVPEHLKDEEERP